MSQLKLFCIALQFLTRIPVTGRLAAWVGYSDEMLRASARYFACIGALVGLVGAAAFAATAQLWPVEATHIGIIPAVLCCCATAWLTGGFHEDGLTDYVDGMGGGHTPERVLEIMKDSRVGSYGVLAILFATLLKVFSLSGMTLWHGVCAIVVAHTVGRACACAVMFSLRYVRGDDTSKNKPMADAMHRSELVIVLATVAFVLALVLLSAPELVWHALFALALASVSSIALALHMRRRIGGFTGDALGAVEQCAEVAVILAFAAHCAI